MAHENISQVIESSPFIQKHSALLRIWHWVTFLILSGSMITVLIISTMLNPRANIALVQNQLKGKGVAVSEEQAFAVSHEYEDKMWEVHKLLGFGLAFLLASRLLIELVQPREEKIRSRIKNAIILFKLNDKNKVEYRHYVYVKRMYLLFYLILLLMALTGLGLAFGRELGFPRQIHNLLKTVHSLFQYFMYAFVFLHLCGVIIAENSKIKGIVSGMINGN
ncbi:MAG: cytochrome b/b6 domain-containing protein [Bacteroidia bacterium]|nr:cytochrome b/b6 domain-containing protein [Bacteroidia bacterium]